VTQTFPVGKLPVEELKRLLQKYASTDPRLIVGGAIGQDAAVIDMGDRYLVAKTDPITFATGQIGWYAVNVNANDIACTGATPRWFLATILLPEGDTGPDLADNIFAQIHAACDRLGVSVAGGHTEITAGLSRPIVVGQMLGEVAPDQLVTTSGTRPGDTLILTKGYAIEATAIIGLEMAATLRDSSLGDKINHYANFLVDPGISVVSDAAVALAAGGVHAMHDPTEGGLATGLYELAEAAGVGLEIYADRLPLLPETRELADFFNLDPLGLIASGALLISATPDATGVIITALEKAGIPAAVIGQALRPEEGRWLLDPTGSQPLPTFVRDEITRLFE
jgi:hydrogenase maturation factor